MKIVNIFKNSFDVYIGRPSIYGNPWTMSYPTITNTFMASSRKEAIDNYKEWLLGNKFTDVLQDKRIEILNTLPQLKGKILGCFCKPKACHGDILVELCNKMPTIDEFM